MTDLNKIDIKKLIPQKDPFVMVEKLLYCDEMTTITSLTIKENNIFLDNGVLQNTGLLENAAQTCAARIGYLTIDNPIRIGFIGAVNNFEFTQYPVKVGDTIVTKTVIETEIGNIVVISAKIECKKQLIATGKIKVVLM